MLPLERYDDEKMPLSEAGNLMPYHNGVDLEAEIDAFNYMIEEVEAGQKIFNDITIECRVESLRALGTPVEYHLFSAAKTNKYHKFCYRCLS